MDRLVKILVIKAKIIILGCLVLAAIVPLIDRASATSITVANPSFEDQSGLQSGCPTDWSCGVLGSGFTGGVYAPTSIQYSPGPADGLATGLIVPDGDEVAYLISGAIGQTPTTIADDTTYTLSVYLGLRAESSYLWPGATIELYAFNTTSNVSTVLAFLTIGDCGVSSSTCVANGPANGQWVQYSVSYITGAANPYAGEDLAFAIGDDGYNEETQQLNVDDVTFTNNSTSIPEPASLAILGTSLLGLGGFNCLRRRRKPTPYVRPLTRYRQSSTMPASG